METSILTMRSFRLLTFGSIVRSVKKGMGMYCTRMTVKTLFYRNQWLTRSSMDCNWWNLIKTKALKSRLGLMRRLLLLLDRPILKDLVCLHQLRALYSSLQISCWTYVNLKAHWQREQILKLSKNLTYCSTSTSTVRVFVIFT
jgi:hypothetical protein